jgi:hypothetical protein
MGHKVIIMASMGNNTCRMMPTLRYFHKNLNNSILILYKDERAILRLLYIQDAKKKKGASQNKSNHHHKRQIDPILWPIFVGFEISLQYVYYEILRVSGIFLNKDSINQYLFFEYQGTFVEFTGWLIFHLKQEVV